MTRRTGAVWLVDSISLSRLLAALLFASMAFQNVPVALLVGLYVFAICTDVIDGLLARKLRADSYFGKVVDLVSDKSMTIVSLLYAAARGITVFPLALIAVRELIMIGARIIIVEETQLLPTNKIVGGVLTFLLWGNTMFLVLVREDYFLTIANNIYWVCAVIYTANLLARIAASSRRIAISMQEIDPAKNRTNVRKDKNLQ